MTELIASGADTAAGTSNTQMGGRRGCRLALAALAVSAVATSVAPMTAHAETFSSKITKASGLYDCSGSAAVCGTKIADAAVGTKARMVCWEEGRSADSQKKWFYVRLSNGKQGYIPASRVGSQTSVKACWDKNAGKEIQGVIAANWALARNGQVSVPDAEKKLLNTQWGFSLNYTLGDWSGDCITFAAIAWYNAGVKITIRNARQVFDTYNAAKRISTDRNPPRGALVFWNAVDNKGVNYGHVEISLGNGRSIGTSGWDNQKKPISIEAISASNYLGWVMP